MQMKPWFRNSSELPRPTHSDRSIGELPRPTALGPSRPSLVDVGDSCFCVGPCTRREYSWFSNTVGRNHCCSREVRSTQACLRSEPLLTSGDSGKGRSLPHSFPICFGSERRIADIQRSRISGGLKRKLSSAKRMRRSETSFVLFD